METVSTSIQKMEPKLLEPINNKGVEESKAKVMRTATIVTANNIARPLIMSENSKFRQNHSFDDRSPEAVKAQQQRLDKSIKEHLLEDEIKLYGVNSRCPKGYTKQEILGKGGCAVVWLCQDIENDRKVAIKQFPKSKSNEHNYNSAIEELKINKCFYQINGEPYDVFKGHPGLDNICKLLNTVETKQDLWLVFELCGKPLSKLLYNTKG